MKNGKKRYTGNGAFYRKAATKVSDKDIEEILRHEAENADRGWASSSRHKNLDEIEEDWR